MHNSLLTQLQKPNFCLKIRLCFQTKIRNENPKVLNNYWIFLNFEFLAFEFFGFLEILIFLIFLDFEFFPYIFSFCFFIDFEFIDIFTRFDFLDIFFQIFIFFFRFLFFYFPRFWISEFMDKNWYNVTVCCNKKSYFNSIKMFKLPLRGKIF